jgi:hypothetical protein
VAWLGLAALLVGCETRVPLTPRDAVIEKVYETVSPHRLRIASGGPDADGRLLYAAMDGDIRLYYSCGTYLDEICPSDRSPLFGPRAWDYAGGQCTTRPLYECQSLDCEDDPQSCARLSAALDAQVDDVTYVRERLPSGKGDHKHAYQCLGVAACR